MNIIIEIEEISQMFDVFMKNEIKISKGFEAQKDIEIFFWCAFIPNQMSKLMRS